MDYCQELFLSLTKVQAYIFDICSLGEEIPMIAYLKKELYLEVMSERLGCCDYNRCNFLLESLFVLKRSLIKQCEGYNLEDFVKEFKHLRNLIKENSIEALQDELNELDMFLDSFPIEILEK